MKPGTKSRKLGLEIPTVNPCNDFIIDYLIRNKIKSDKQVLCKSFLYNLAIQAVRKYPLPLICEQQLAALQGFGNFFIGQVGRLIKRHYNRGRLPTEKQMQEDDEYHFEVLRAKNKPTDEKNSRAYNDRDLDSPIFSRTKQTEQRRKNYRPKRNTEPYNILQSLIQLGADERAVTKGDINEILFNKGKQKIRLWYMLRQKLQQYDLIQLDPKNQDYIYLTEKGKQYIQNYDKQEQKRLKWGRRKVKDQSDDEEDQQEHKSQRVSESTSKKKTIVKQQQQYSEDQKMASTKSKTKSKAQQQKISKIVAQMQIKKTTFPKNTKFQSIDLLVNIKDSDTSQKQTFFQNTQQLSYQFCQIQLADFLWSTDGKILDYMVIRIKNQQFDEEEFKTICFRAKMTTCQNIFIILEGQNKQSNVKNQQSENQKPPQEEQFSKEQLEQKRNYMVASATVAGFKVIRTKNLPQTLKFVEEMTNFIYKKLLNYQNIDRTKKLRKQKNSVELVEVQDIKYFGNIEKFNKKISYPYQILTITSQIMKQIPDLNMKCIKILQQKLPTLAALYKKIQNSGTTKEKKLFIRSYLIDEKVNDESLNILVQILFYETY